MTSREKIDKIIRGVIFSYFGEEGPAPARSGWFPDDNETELDLRILHLVALKSLSLLAGETGSYPEPNLASIIPFPHLNMSCLVYLFEIPEEKARGKRVDSCISVLFTEKFSPLIYKHIVFLTDYLKKISLQLTELFHKKDEENEPFRNVIVKFYDNLTNFLEDYRATELKKWQLQEISKATIDYKIKIIVLGDPGVGKTTLLLRYVDQAFRELYIPTTGVQISTKRVKIGDDIIQLNLWDLAGEKKFKELQRIYYEGAVEGGVIFAYDITRKKSFESLSNWIEDLQAALTVNVKDIDGTLIGNKVDLKATRQVSIEEGKKLAEKYDLRFFETSALTGENVDEVFHDMAEKVYNRLKQNHQ
ncbi:MAG: Rab family GTPase [Candidatus Helarchaeota archaeon]